MKKLKVVVIGGGSSYTPELIDGMIKNHERLPISELVLVDIEMGREKLEIIEAFTRRMLLKANLDVKVSATLDRRSALIDADFVLTQFRVGGLAARHLDESIPLTLGLIGQETTGAGGFGKALRTIPVILEITRDMEELCPEAWLINFTNPSGIITTAVKKHSRIKCIGLCNIPISMEKNILKLLEVTPERLYLSFSGLNHLSFVRKAFLDGKDITSQLIQKSIENDSVVKNVPGIAWSTPLLSALQMIPSPYLKYFYQTEDMLQEERKAMENGTSRAQSVMKVEKELFELYKDPNLNEKPEILNKRGGAYYSEIAISLINSIYNNTSQVHVVNTENRGAIPHLPYDSIVETNCIINHTGAHPIVSEPLPLTVLGLVQQVKAYEELTVEAATRKSKALALMALVNHPLVRDAVLAQKLLDKIMEAHPDYIKGYH